MKKLYLNDSYKKNFTANVTHILNKDGKCLVVLDETAFYPEGGGQPSDTGSIGDSWVNYVYEEDGTIYHVVNKEPSDHKDVKCSIDWARRFDHMQQHCGQHILSAAFYNTLGGATVGFHLGDEYVTIDIDLDSFDYEDALRIENIANQIVFNNLAIKYHYPELGEISKFPLRKAPTVTENIRIVEIDGFDYSPCGGTHPKYTGEVGLIKLRRWEKYKGGFRIEFICGGRALKDYTRKNTYMNEISAILSSKETDAVENLKKLVSELQSAKNQIKLLKDKTLTYEARDLYNSSEMVKGVKIVNHTFEDMDFKDLTILANKIAKMESVIALLGLKSENTARMVFTRSDDVDIDVNELFKEVVHVINGKGGGSPKSAQGGGSDFSNLNSALDSAYIILKNRYLK